VTDGDDRTTVLLVRHGETDWNREGRILGQAPVPVNDRGRKQARRLGRVLADEYEIDRMVGSDLRRTRETAALVSDAGVGIEPTFERDWRERDVGTHQGLPRAWRNRQYPAHAFESGAIALEAQPERGERLLDAYERVVEHWERLCADAGPGTVLVVTHGGPITGILGHLKGDDLMTTIAEHTVTPCSLTEIRLGNDVTIRRETEQVIRPVEE